MKWILLFISLMIHDEVFSQIDTSRIKVISKHYADCVIGESDEEVGIPICEDVISIDYPVVSTQNNKLDKLINELV